MIAESWRKVTTEYSKLTFASGLILVISFIPDWHGRYLWWRDHTHWAVSHLSSTEGRVVLVVCSMLVIWWDHRRVLKKQEPKPYDEKTLKGQTLKLRDDLKRFLKDVGPRPQVELAPGMSTQDFLKASWATITPWSNKLSYGYELRFAPAVREIHLKFGELNLLPGIVIDVPLTVSSEEEVLGVIEKLDALAAKAP